MFDDPPISIHHDFSQCELDRNAFQSNVRFVIPSLSTKWGDWSLTEAALAAIQNLFERQDHPRWMILLSGNDYPIQKPDKIKAFYENTRFHAFASSKKLTEAKLSTKRELYWYARYHWPKINYPSIFHVLKSIKKRKLVKEPIVLKEKWALRFLTPFSPEYPCYGGSFWFSANREAVKELVHTFENNRKLCRYYKHVLIPDESFFVTVLNNAKNLDVYNFNFRFTDWVRNIGPHPKQLTLSDLPALVRAEEHFARKIDMDTDPDLLDKLDELIGS